MPSCDGQQPEHVEVKVEESEEMAADEVVERGYDPKIFVDVSDIQKLLCFLCKWVAKEAVVLSYPAHEDDDALVVF